jgi:acyl-CoA synthetase (AMP-forming)/AMP-acid ligase II/1-acyl-sn-glycerol-3-phosphate acyltransferase
LDSSLERDLGLGSLERVELLVRLEKRFDRRLPDTLAQNAETPADWVRALSVGQASHRPRERYRVEQPTREPPAAPESARTWVEVLRHHAAIEPERVQIHLLEGDSGQDISYSKLLETASRVAIGLRERGLAANQTVAIMLPTSADFFYAFFGVMLAGGVAVPIYPPARPDKIEEYVQRQVKILRNAEVRFLISFDRVRAVSKLMSLGLPGLRGVTSVAELERVGQESGARPRSSDVQAADIAFIQYTSGSTGDPKGVILTQSNVLANVRGIGSSVRFRPDDIVVTWLPLYHDMGLIGSWLFSVYYGAPITVLSPLDFLSRPERWLWALHDSGGTLCPAPNFSYELCARKIREESIRGLDLSRWRVAINAGEAVLPETLSRFAKRFAPYGFREEAFVPCYGLAESSVALTFPPIDRAPVIDTIDRDIFTREGRAVADTPVQPDSLKIRQPANGAKPEEHVDGSVVRFVANGTALPEHEVRLVDDDGHPVGERVQGRIFFRGPSRTPGYYRNPEASAAVIDAEGWMDSGDLGYWARGELFVTGRAKDLIIKAGHNIVPQEIEAAAAEVKGVRRGCVAAFGSRDPHSGTERVVVVAETREAGSEERKRIRSEIVQRASAAAVPPDQVILVPPQSIPKTSSGKIRRNETRRLFEEGGLGGSARSPAMQMASLALGNARAGAGRAARGALSSARRGYHAAIWAAILSVTSSLAAGIPGSRRKARLARAAARWLMRLTGPRVRLEPETGLDGAPALLVANREGSLDALILAASLRVPFVLAGTSEVEYRQHPAGQLLRHLVVGPVPNADTPPGGRLRDRIRHALEAGHSVLVLPDNAIGSRSSSSRFRLDAFHAAVLASRPIVPLAVRGTAYALDPRHYGVDHNATIRVGRPIDPGSCDQRQLVELRDRVRAEIAELAR